MWCGGAGLMLVLLYGREGWFAPLIRATGFNIVFAFPGQLPAPQHAQHALDYAHGQF